MAIWTLSQLDELSTAFTLVQFATWRIPPLSLSPLLARCEQDGLDKEELRVLRLLAHGDLKPLAQAVITSRSRPTDVDANHQRLERE